MEKERSPVVLKSHHTATGEVTLRSGFSTGTSLVFQEKGPGLISQLHGHEANSIADVYGMTAF